MEIEPLDAEEAADALSALAELLLDAVVDASGPAGSAAVEAGEAETWWRGEALPEVAAGSRLLLGAFDEDRLLGCVQVRLPGLPGARHRAELLGLVVHSGVRRHGVGRALLAAAEEAAAAAGRTLVVTEAVAGSPAETLLRSAGYTVSGRVEGHILLPGGAPVAASILTRRLPGMEDAAAPPRLRIRGARAGDAAELGVVQVRAWQEAYRGAMPDEFLDGLDPGLPESQWREALTYPRAADRVWVLERDEQVAAFVHTGTSRDRDAVTGSAEILALYVRPEDAGRGMGRQLLEHALDDVRRRGARWVTAWVFEGSERGRRLLEAAGMEDDHRTRVFSVMGEPMREVRYRLVVAG